MEIHAAYDLLGLQPDATQKQVDAAFRLLSKGCHPDHFPDDQDALQRFLRITDARDTIAAHKARGTGGFAPSGAPAVKPDPVGDPIVMYGVAAPAGSGKTREWARAVAQSAEIRPVVPEHAFIWPPSRPYRVIIASPTIELITETAKALAEFGAKNFTIIHSEDGAAGKTVTQKLQAFFSKLKLDQECILLITHTALINLPTSWQVRDGKDGALRTIFLKDDWDLTIDEAPDVITFLERSWPDLFWLISREVVALEYSASLLLLQPIDPPAQQRLRLIGLGGAPNREGGYTDYKEVAAAIASPGKIVLVNVGQWEDLTTDRHVRRNKDLYFGGKIDFAVLILPELFQPFRSFSMMGARLQATMPCVLWPKVANVAFRTHPLQAKLMPRHTKAQGQRLHIYYVFEERCTRQFLARKSEDGKTMFRSMADKVALFFKNIGAKNKKASQFIWTAPLYRADSEHGVKNNFFEPTKRGGFHAFHPDLRLPGRTHGLNKFRQYHNAALLSVINFTPNQYAMLQDLGLTEQEIDRAFGHNIIHQDALRCSLRDRDLRTRVNIAVPDRATAIDLGADFPGCQIAGLPADLVPVAAIKRQPGPRAQGNAKSSTERVRQFRAKQQAGEPQDTADEKARLQALRAQRRRDAARDMARGRQEESAD